MQVKDWDRRTFLRMLAGGSVAAAAGSLLSTRAAYAAGTADGVPITDRGKALEALRTGGRGTREAAARALVGTDADVASFVANDLARLQVEDARVAVLTMLPYAGKGVYAAAQTALSGTGAEIHTFLASGYQTSLAEDRRVAVLTLMNNGGRAMKTAYQKALDDGSAKALDDFLTTGQHTARAEDNRVDTLTVMFAGGPEVQKQANRALDSRRRGRRLVPRDRPAHRARP